MTINDVGNDLIEKVANMKIKYVGNNIIVFVVNMTINDAGNNLNGVKANVIQVQFEGDPAVKTHQNLLSRQKIRIRHEEFPVLDPPMETSIGANN